MCGVAQWGRRRAQTQVFSGSHLQDRSDLWLKGLELKKASELLSGAPSGPQFSRELLWKHQSPGRPDSPPKATLRVTAPAETFPARLRAGDRAPRETPIP